MGCTTDEITTVITADGDIYAKRGDTFDITIEVLYCDDDTPYDLTSFDTLTMQVKRAAKDDTYILEFTLGAGIFVTENRVQLVKDNDTMNIPATTYAYDLQGTLSGVVTTLFQGKFIVSEDVTRLVV